MSQISDVGRAAYWQSPHEHLPDEQRTALKKAVVWQVVTILFTIGTITLVATVMGNSQSMKTAWIEDMLSLIPQLSFLVALLVIRRPTTRRHPYGRHRAMEVGHLVAGVALSAVGAVLAFESAMGLLNGEQPTIGSVQLFGHTIWLGWLMVATMALIVIGPLVYGPAKLKLAPKLHNKVLFTDADMAKADWHTNAASIVGVLGVGVGLWWLDGAAAIFISIGIIFDGVGTRAWPCRTSWINRRAASTTRTRIPYVTTSSNARGRTAGWRMPECGCETRARCSMRRSSCGPQARRSSWILSERSPMTSGASTGSSTTSSSWSPTLCPTTRTEDESHANVHAAQRGEHDG